MLQFMLSLFKTYFPVGMGISFLYSYEKSKIQNLIKFFVLRAVLSFLEFILVSIFMLPFSIINYAMIPIYIYLTIYSYGYSANAFDIVIAPLLHFFIDYHTDLITMVQRQKSRIKVLQDHGKVKAGEIHYLNFLSTFQRFVYNTFNIENMYLLK